MPKFSTNLSMLFTEVAFLERFGRATACGFEAVECMFPYAWSCDQLALDGIQLLVEPLNSHDVPGYFLTGTRQALALIDAVGHPNLALQ